MENRKQIIKRSLFIGIINGFACAYGTWILYVVTKGFYSYNAQNSAITLYLMYFLLSPLLFIIPNVIISVILGKILQKTTSLKIGKSLIIIGSIFAGFANASFIYWGSIKEAIKNGSWVHPFTAIVITLIIYNVGYLKFIVGKMNYSYAQSRKEK